MQIYHQVIAPFLKNFPLAALMWALVAVVSVVANDPTCKSLPMGNAEAILDLAIGAEWKTFLLILVCFYLLPAAYFAFSNKGDRLLELQQKFFQPVAVPLLFQIAGLLGGLMAGQQATGSILMGLAVSGLVVLLALALHNIATIFTPANISKA